MLLSYSINYRANTARDSYGTGRSDWRINTAIFIDDVYDFSFRADPYLLYQNFIMRNVFFVCAEN